MQLTQKPPPPPLLASSSLPRSTPNQFKFLFPFPLFRCFSFSSHRRTAAFASKSPSPLLADDGSHFPDEDAFEYDDDDDEDEDEEDGIEDFAADDYELDVSDGDEESSEELEAEDLPPFPSEKSKSKSSRVEKLCREAKEFGADFIDVHELASVYVLRGDKEINYGPRINGLDQGQQPSQQRKPNKKQQNAENRQKAGNGQRISNN